MAVDGVGKPPIAGLPNEAVGVEAPEFAKRAEFVTSSASKSQASSEAAAVEPTLIQQLQAGQLSPERYLDIRSEQAVAHLVGHMPAQQIELIRTTIRDQLNIDPLLVRLVREATASGPR
jgi:hypothetical protein